MTIVPFSPTPQGPQPGKQPDTKRANGRRTDERRKTKANSEQVAEFERLDAVAKQARPLLPISIQMALPFTPHRKGIVAAHMRKILQDTAALGLTTKSPKTYSALEKVVTTGEAQPELNELDTRAHALFNSSLFSMDPNLATKARAATVVVSLPQMPAGYLKDQQVVNGLSCTQPVIKAMSQWLVKGIQDQTLLETGLQEQLAYLKEAPLLSQDDPMVQQFMAGVSRLQSKESRLSLLSQLAIKAAEKMHIAPEKDTVVSDEGLVGVLFEKVHQEDPHYAWPPQVQQFKINIQDRAEMARKAFERIMQQPDPKSQVKAFLHERHELGFDPTESELQTLIGSINSDSRLYTIVKDLLENNFRENVPVLAKFLRHIQHNGAREAFFCTLLSRINPPGANYNTPEMFQLGLQLIQSPGMDIEKQLYVQMAFGSEDPYLLQVAAHLLMEDTSDTVKASMVLGASQYAKNPCTETLVQAAVFKIKSHVMRSAMKNQLSSNTFGIASSQLERFTEYQRNDELNGYYTLTQKAYEPALRLGLNINTTIKHTLNVLKQCDLDPGILNRDILPDFERLMKLTLAHPEKLVKAGETPPTPDEIRSLFLGSANAQNILLGLIILGRPAMELAVERKRFKAVLASITLLDKEPATWPPLALCKQKAISQFDMLKLAEMSEIFCNNKQGTELAQVLNRIAEGETLDIKPMAAASIQQIANQVGVAVDTVDPEQLERWNLRHINTLVKAFGHENLKPKLKEICKASFEGRFGDYLFNPETPVGQANLQTKETFATYGLNFDTWLNYKKTSAFRLPSRAEYTNLMEQYLIDLYNNLSDEEDKEGFLTTLRNRRAVFGKHAETGALQIVYENSYTPIPEIERQRLMQYMLEDLQRLLPDQKKEFAGLSSTMSRLKEKGEDLEIAVWDRNPGFDLFMGSDTGACTAIDGGSSASIDALQSTFVQMLHLRRPGEKQAVGKVLVFWSKNPDTGNLVCHWNTFEGRGGEGSQYEDNYLVREQIMGFLTEYAKQVSGLPQVPIRTCDTFNPTYKADLKTEVVNCRVVGHMPPNSKYYLDTFSSSAIDIDHTFTKVKLWKMNNVDIDNPETARGPEGEAYRKKLQPQPPLADSQVPPPLPEDILTLEKAWSGLDDATLSDMGIQKEGLLYFISSNKDSIDPAQYPIFEKLQQIPDVKSNIFGQGELTKLQKPILEQVSAYHKMLMNLDAKPQGQKSAFDQLFEDSPIQNTLPLKNLLAPKKYYIYEEDSPPKLMHEFTPADLGLEPEKKASQSTGGIIGQMGMTLTANSSPDWLFTTQGDLMAQLGLPLPKSAPLPSNATVMQQREQQFRDVNQVLQTIDGVLPKGTLPTWQEAAKYSEGVAQTLKHLETSMALAMLIRRALIDQLPSGFVSAEPPLNLVHHIPFTTDLYAYETVLPKTQAELNALKALLHEGALRAQLYPIQNAVQLKHLKHALEAIENKLNKGKLSEGKLNPADKQTAPPVTPPSLPPSVKSNHLSVVSPLTTPAQIVAAMPKPILKGLAQHKKLMAQYAATQEAFALAQQELARKENHIQFLKTALDSLTFLLFEATPDEIKQKKTLTEELNHDSVAQVLLQTHCNTIQAKLSGLKQHLGVSAKQLTAEIQGVIHGQVPPLYVPNLPEIEDLAQALPSASWAGSLGKIMIHAGKWFWPKPNP